MHDDVRKHHDDSRRRDLAETDALRLERWLEAEAGLTGAQSDAPREAEVLEAADEALFALFEALPAVDPPPGFGQRVLARAAGSMVSVGAANPWLARVWRVTVSLAVVLTGCAVLLLPPAVARLTTSVGGSAPIRWLSETLVSLGEALGSALSVWQEMAWLSGVLGRAAASPTGALSLAITLVVVSLAFRLLLELDARDRSWSHAETI